MSCSYRLPFPSEIAADMLAQLLTAATERNEANPTRPEICPTMQTDIPGKILIDVDFPTEDQAIRNKYLCHLEIDTETGEMSYRSVTTPNLETYPIGEVRTLLILMEFIIKSH